MTQKQKRVVIALAVINGIIILALAILIKCSANSGGSPLPTPGTHIGAPTDVGGHSPTSTNSPGPTRESPPATLSTSSTLPYKTCQQKAAQLLAQAGLVGTVTLTPEGAVYLDVAHTLASSQTVEDAAQLVWVAFDVVLSLQEQKDACAPLAQIAVTISVKGDQVDAQIDATVSAADLAAFGAGELSEEAFIERVTYTVSNR